MRSSFGKVFMGAAGGEDLPSDDEFNRVSFLSHFDGANNGLNNVFIDGHDTSNLHTVTTVGNSTQGSFNPYGTNWAVDFSLAANPRLSCDSSADFSFGTGDFTVEFFVFFYSLAGYQTPISLGYNASGGMAIQTGNGTGKFLLYTGSTVKSSETTSDAVAHKWYHIAFSRQSGTLRVFRNGVQTGTASDSTNFNRTGDILIGSDRNYNIDGLLSNVRLVKGTSLYNSGFTPPSSALTAVTNTKLLTCQSNRFVDNSASGHTVDPVSGTEELVSFGPFLTSSVYDPAVNGASGYFEGTGDYLSVANSSDFYMENGAYTIEFWIFDGPGGTQYIFDNYKTGTSGGMNMYLTTSGRVYFRFSGDTDGYKDTITGTGTFEVNQWNHIAVVRTYASSNTTVVIYVNGVAKATETFNGYTAQSNTSEALTIGNAYQGYICDFRMVKGTAVYTGNFTPPTAPLTAITNTKLLLNMANGQAIDSAAQNNLRLAGNAKISTGQAKFGDTSLYLDGSGDYFEVPNPTSLAFGTSNFTLECWVYMAVDNTNKAIVETRASDLSANGFVFAIDANGGRKLMVYSNAKLFTTSNAISLNTWTHIAISRSGTTLKCFINGTQGASVTNSQDYTNTLVRVGMGIYNSSGFNGYIDDLRFSNMARYTANFTAPAEPFADKGQ